MAGFASGAVHTGNSTGVRGTTTTVKPTTATTTVKPKTLVPSWTTGGTAVPATKDGLSSQLIGDIKAVYSLGPLGLSTYAGLSPTTMAGINSIKAAANDANANGYFGDAIDYAGNLVQNNGLTNWQRQAQQGNAGLLSAYAGLGDKNGLTQGMQNRLIEQGGVNTAYGDIANSLTGPSAAQTGYTSMYQAGGGPSLTEQTLMGTARGDYLNGANPYFENNLANATDQTRNAVNASIGGRYGSNVHTQDLTQQIGNLQNSARGQQYEMERDRQAQALASIEGTRQQDFTNRFNTLGASDASRLAQVQAREGALAGQSAGLQSAFNMGQTGVGNQFNALAGQNTANQNQFNFAQQGINNAMNAGNNLGSLYQQSLMPGQTKLAAGQLLDADAQAKLNDQNNIKNKDFNYLSQYLGLLGGAQPDKEKSNPFTDILGLIGAGASIFL